MSANENVLACGRVPARASTVMLWTMNGGSTNAAPPTSRPSQIFSPERRNGRFAVRHPAKPFSPARHLTHPTVFVVFQNQCPNFPWVAPCASDVLRIAAMLSPLFPVHAPAVPGFSGQSPDAAWKMLSIQFRRDALEFQNRRAACFQSDNRTSPVAREFMVITFSANFCAANISWFCNAFHCFPPRQMWALNTMQCECRCGSKARDVS